jgi:probable rRNA maturation factor
VGGPGAVEVYVADEQSVPVVDLDRWRALALAALDDLGVRGAAELTLLFVDREHITVLNREYMGGTGPTDVLAFPIDGAELSPDEVSDRTGPANRRGPGRGPSWPDDQPLLLGDVVVCPAVAAEQAPAHAGTLDDELALLVVHGVLHVLGFDHHTDEERTVMRAHELRLLERHHWGHPAPAGFRQAHTGDAVPDTLPPDTLPPDTGTPGGEQA